jgi:hypothetical protein
MHGAVLAHLKGKQMPKRKRKNNGSTTAGFEFEVIRSVEVEKSDRLFLPKRFRGILVKDDIVREKWLFPKFLRRLLAKRYIKPKLQKKNKKGKAKAAH